MNINEKEKEKAQITIAQSFEKKSPSYSFDHPRASAIHDLIFDLFSDDLLPFNMIKGNAFTKLIQTLEPKFTFSFFSLSESLHQFFSETRYVIPSTTYFSDILLPKRYNEAKEKVKTVLLGASSISYTTDCWTSVSNDAYMATSAHFITADWKLLDVHLHTTHFPESHTGKNIAEKLTESTASMVSSLTKEVAFVSDSAANAVKAGEFLTFPRYPCFAHQLQLIIHGAIDSPDLTDLISKCKKIVGHFRHSAKASHELKLAVLEAKPDSDATKLIQDVPTRWNSTLFMLERLLQLRSFVNKISSNHKTFDLQVSDKEADLLDSIVTCLLPFQEATKMSSGSTYPTCSIIYPMTFAIIECLDKVTSPRQASSFAASLSNSIQEVFHSNLDRNLGLATVLDPRFKDLTFLPYNHHWHTAITADLKEAFEKEKKKADKEKDRIPMPSNAAPKSKQPIAGSFAAILFSDKNPVLKSELGAYWSITISDKIDVDPIQWWKLHEREFPTLSKLARELLATPATSVPVESNFSKSGRLVSKRRASLKPAKVEQLMFLHQNKKYL